MEHEIEYPEEMVKMLELIWGEGFMAPGGEGNVAHLIDGLNVQNKRILDIGCGIGGPAFVLANKYGARVTGIDIEAHLIDHAQIRAKELGLEKQTEFNFVKPGALDFPDESFDVVFSSGALTQVENKLGIYQESWRVLNPGGTFTCYDWMKPRGEYSQDMLYWFELEGITYAMETPERHKETFQEAGFINVRIKDKSDWYRREAIVEYEKLKSNLYTSMVELLGQEDADHFVESWRMLVIICDKREMLQVYCRGQKPT